MLETETIPQSRVALDPVRRQGRRIGFVPTMGALHEGHASLIRAARERSDFVAVSIFVNPTQFAPGEDLASYPRPLEADRKLCRELGVDLLFRPAPREIYPTDGFITVNPGPLARVLCGASRPGHFVGVCTVVAKLFNIIQPDLACFGQKDAQQLLIIRHMVSQLDFPVEIVACPTVRQPDGLAISSRNARLSPPQRQQAVCLYRALKHAEELIHNGSRRVDDVIAAMQEVILAAEPADLPRPKIDYLAVSDPETLEPLTTVDRPSLLALAVHLDPARLIDNLVVEPR